MAIIGKMQTADIYHSLEIILSLLSFGCYGNEFCWYKQSGEACRAANSLPIKIKLSIFNYQEGSGNFSTANQKNRSLSRDYYFIFIFSLKQNTHMNVQIQTVHFDADNKLTERINQKMEKLRTFHDKIVDVEIYLILDNVAHQIKDKIAEIKVHVPRHSFFVKHQSKTFEESFDFAFDSMVNQIKRYKERRAATPVEMPE